MALSPSQPTSCTWHRTSTALVSLSDFGTLPEPQAVERKPFGWLDAALAREKAAEKAERDPDAVILWP